MAMSVLRRIAAQAPAPTYVLALGDQRGLVGRLRLDERIDVVDSPRHASILLVASPLPEPLHTAARLVHDQMPHPRGVVGCAGTANIFPADVFPVDVFQEAGVASADDAASAVRQAYRCLQLGERASSKPSLGRENPVDWRGVGPHGQGGKAMMGGTPYGRPMAMTAEDVRDGLQLDRVEATVGPFLPWMPPGLELAVVLQGDLLQEVTPRVPSKLPKGLPSDLPDIFAAAVDQPVSIAKLELARARHHLAAIADMLLLHGLDRRARQALGLADNLPTDAASLQTDTANPIRRFARSLRWTFALRLGARDVGCLEAAKLRGLGPVSRASGNPEDARTDDPAYQPLDFDPVTHDRGDALARFRQRLAEAAQSVELAGRAAEQMRAPGPTVEGPRGPIDHKDAPQTRGSRWNKLVSDYAPGTPWDEFVTTLVSLDIDPSRLSPSDEYASSRVGCHVDHDEHDEDDGEDDGDHDEHQHEGGQ